jgi:hypothetical protein
MGGNMKPRRLWIADCGLSSGPGITIRRQSGIRNLESATKSN